jgi:hypothetical protein
MIKKPMERGATEMTEHSKRTPTANSWADYIDDLYHDAMEKNLKAMMFYARARSVALDADAAEEHLPGSGSGQRRASAGSNLQ